MDRDWTVEVTDRIESTVEMVRSKTVEPATKAVDMLVFGVVAGVLGLVAFVSLVLVILRLLYVYLPIDPVSRRIWVADAIMGAIFLGSGMFAWRKRVAKPS
jgi:hypothetical protein